MLLAKACTVYILNLMHNAYQDTYLSNRFYEAFGFAAYNIQVDKMVSYFTGTDSETRLVQDQTVHLVLVLVYADNV